MDGEAEEGGGELQYDQASNLYFDSSTSPIKYYHWNPKEQKHMLVVIPDDLIGEWGYFQVCIISCSSPFLFCFGLVWFG